MSHTVFQTAQIMPIYTSTIPTSKAVSSQKQLLHPAGALHRLPLPQAVAGKMRKACIRASSSVVDGDAVSALERCFQASPPADCPSSTSSAAGSPVMFAPVMKGGKYGSLGAVTLEKSKLDMSQKQTKSSPELSTGGGGGDIGKSIFHGGGDGGDDGDDDDYMDDFDDDDEGDEGGLFRRRMILQELFDRKFVDAVLKDEREQVERSSVSTSGTGNKGAATSKNSGRVKKQLCRTPTKTPVLLPLFHVPYHVTSPAGPGCRGRVAAFLGCTMVERKKETPFHCPLSSFLHFSYPIKNLIPLTVTL